MRGGGPGRRVKQRWCGAAIPETAYGDTATCGAERRAEAPACIPLGTLTSHNTHKRLGLT